MTRNKDTDCHQRIAAEQNLKIAEKAREHQVEIQAQIRVENEKAAELKRKWHRNNKRCSKQLQIAEERRTKNTRWKLRSRKSSKLSMKLSLQLKLLKEKKNFHTTKKTRQRAASVVREKIRRENGNWTPEDLWKHLRSWKPSTKDAQDIIQFEQIDFEQIEEKWEATSKAQNDTNRAKQSFVSKNTAQCKVVVEKNNRNLWINPWRNKPKRNTWADEQQHHTQTQITNVNGYRSDECRNHAYAETKSSESKRTSPNSKNWPERPEEERNTERRSKSRKVLRNNASQSMRNIFTKEKLKDKYMLKHIVKKSKFVKYVDKETSSGTQISSRRKSSRNTFAKLHRTSTMKRHNTNSEELTKNNIADLFRKDTWTSNLGWYEWWRLRIFEKCFQSSRCVSIISFQQLTERTRQLMSPTTSKTTWFHDCTSHKRLTLSFDATLGIKAHRWVLVNTHDTPMPAKEGGNSPKSPQDSNTYTTTDQLRWTFTW